MVSSRHVVAELPQFIRDAEALELSDEARQAIINAVSADPLKGDEVRGWAVLGRCDLPAAERAKVVGIE
jgi:hypothetical protein